MTRHVHIDVVCSDDLKKGCYHSFFVSNLDVCVSHSITSLAELTLLISNSAALRTFGSGLYVVANKLDSVWRSIDKTRFIEFFYALFDAMRTREMGKGNGKKRNIPWVALDRRWGRYKEQEVNKAI